MVLSHAVPCKSGKYICIKASKMVGKLYLKIKSPTYPPS